MRIGILTWFFGNNYGAKAHSFALQEVLKELGHSVEMISYYPKNMAKTNIRMNLNSPHIKYHPILFGKCLLRCKYFDDWTKKKYQTSKEVKCATEIDQYGYDCIIVGSDEVFNYQHPFFDEIYYGVGLTTPLIAYAPSSGQADSSKCLPDKERNGLNQFIALSARDDHTRDLIQNNVHRNVSLVLDPTLLYEFDFSEDMFKDYPTYLLVYSFDTWDVYGTRLQEFAKNHGLKIVCIGRNSKWADVSFAAATEYMWFSAFKHASCVFTDSFHGVIFSVKNRKQFMIVGRRDKINKINDLMDTLGVTRLFYDGSITMEKYFHEIIDYEQVNAVLIQRKRESIDFLIDALEDCQNYDR